jgi:hypothetical protein
MDRADDVKLAERITRIEEGQRNLAVRMDQGFGNLRGDLARYLETRKEDEERIRTLEREQAQHCTAIATQATALGDYRASTNSRLDKLTSRINTWGGGNSLAILLAYVIEFVRGL